jgi:hypothetical protein
VGLLQLEGGQNGCKSRRWMDKRFSISKRESFQGVTFGTSKRYDKGGDSPNREILKAKTTK